ncbi:MAG: ABC transporter permease [Bacillota bacterium]
MTLKSFVSRLRTDLVVMYRSGFVAATLVVAVLLIALIRFALPGALPPSMVIYLVDESGEMSLEEITDATLIRLENEDELRAAMETDPAARGLVFEGHGDSTFVTVHLQGGESRREQRALEALGEGLSRRSVEGDFGLPVNSIGIPGERPPFNLSMVPMFLGLEVALVGLFLATVMVFTEKSEGTVKAYSVTPRGAWIYLGSKLVATSILTLVYGTLLYVTTLGPDSGYVASMGLILLGSAAITSAGLALATHFDGLSDFIYPMIGISLALGLPALVYLSPSVTIPGLRFIPTHPLVFGLREILFPTGREDIVHGSWLLLTGSLIIFATWAHRVLATRFQMEV